MTSGIVIRELEQLSAIEPIERLQAEIFGYGLVSGPPFPYPTRCLFEFVESGGLVLGAYLASGKMIAFAAAWIGREKVKHELYLHSQLLGVLPTYRDQGLGFELKACQRDFARREGLRTIKWTFDPTQARSGYLNLAKLGAVVRRFVPDYFGPLGGTMNRSLATDRFWAEWQVDDLSGFPAERRVDSPDGVSVVNQVETHDVPRCTAVNLSFENDVLLVEVPLRFQELRDNNPEVASDWQSKMRSIFLHYLPRYAVVNAIRTEAHFYYVLKREPVSANMP